MAHETKPSRTAHNNQRSTAHACHLRIQHPVTATHRNVTITVSTLSGERIGRPQPRGEPRAYVLCRDAGDRQVDLLPLANPGRRPWVRDRCGGEHHARAARPRGAALRRPAHDRVKKTSYSAANITRSWKFGFALAEKSARSWPLGRGAKPKMARREAEDGAARSRRWRGAMASTARRDGEHRAGEGEHRARDVRWVPGPPPPPGPPLLVRRFHVAQPLPPSRGPAVHGDG
jgi:hypothetical protein